MTSPSHFQSISSVDSVSLPPFPSININTNVNIHRNNLAKNESQITNITSIKPASFSSYPTTITTLAPTTTITYTPSQVPPSITNMNGYNRSSITNIKKRCYISW